MKTRDLVIATIIAIVLFGLIRISGIMEGEKVDETKQPILYQGEIVTPMYPADHHGIHSWFMVKRDSHGDEVPVLIHNSVIENDPGMALKLEPEQRIKFMPLTAPSGGSLFAYHSTTF